jgi:hypothetical protein
MLTESFDGIKLFITDCLGVIHGKIFDISRLITNEKELNSLSDISLELTNAAINSLGNDLSSLLYKLYKDRNVTIDTILRLARKTWDSVDKLEAQFNSKMFFVARPEKIPERENTLTRNLFKLYLEVGIIIEDELKSFQNEVRMILLTTREMVWSLSHNLKFLARNEEEKYKVVKMLKAFKVFRVRILDVVTLFSFKTLKPMPHQI